jgi:acyl carrier protein
MSSLLNHDLEKEKIEQVLIQSIADLKSVNPDQIDPRKPLKAYGLDSAEFCQMIGKFNDWIGMIIQRDFNISEDFLDQEMTIEKSSQHLANFVSLQNKATEIFGSAEIAIEWMKRPVPALGNQIPNHLLKTPEGMQNVYTSLMRIEYGVYS